MSLAVFLITRCEADPTATAQTTPTPKPPSTEIAKVLQATLAATAARTSALATAVVTAGTPTPAESRPDRTPTSLPSPTRPLRSTTPVPPTASPTWVLAQVVRILDGDTIDVDPGGSVRVIGYDCPERGEQYFELSREEVRRRLMVLGRGEIWLESDQEDRDKYDRLLRHVWYKENPAHKEPVLLSVDIMFAGVGCSPLTIAPNTKYAQEIEQVYAWARDLAAATQTAAAAWSIPTPPRPSPTATPRPTSTPTRVPTPTSALRVCDYSGTSRPVIKGNISFETGERIYHVPGGEFYNATMIDVRWGERWFCTEAEAQAAGWRRSLR
ncbi:MAG: hypothetical protein HY331_16595 [Chloroflexi bacterium]|nr:hypothetical protein [Chloroflexota bacterium]